MRRATGARGVALASALVVHAAILVLLWHTPRLATEPRSARRVEVSLLTTRSTVSAPQRESLAAPHRTAVSGTALRAQSISAPSGRERPTTTRSREPSEADSLDMETLRQQARSFAATDEFTRTDTALAPQNLLVAPSTAQRLRDTVNQAKKPDCSQAYAGLGVFAIPLLVASALRGNDCKW